MSLLDDIDPIFLQDDYFDVLTRRHGDKKNRVVNGMYERCCSMCNEWLDVSLFGVQRTKTFLSSHIHQGLQSACKGCQYDYSVRHNERVKRLKRLSQGPENK